MAIQLVIRHNLEEHEATFVPGELRTYEGREVRIGSGGECECAVAAVGGDALPATAAVLGQQGKAWTVSRPSKKWNSSDCSIISTGSGAKPVVLVSITTGQTDRFSGLFSIPILRALHTIYHVMKPGTSLP